MKKIVSVLIFLYCAPSFSETCKESKDRWSTMKSLTSEKVNTLYNECLNEEKRATEYWAWRKSNLSDKGIYYFDKNTIVCVSKEKFIKTYNSILSNGGIYNPKKLRSAGGCTVLQGWSIGRIIKSKQGSNVVQIQYQKPFAKKAVSEGWVHTDTIETLENYKRRAAN